MPSASIATGTPSTLALNNTCPHVNSLPGMPPTAVDPPHIGLFVSVKVVPASTGLVASGFTRKLTYGASNILMTSVAVIDCAGSPTNGWIEVFYLQDVVSGNGAASVVNYTNRNLADTANAAVKSIELDSGTYGHMYQITPGSIQTLTFTGGAANIFIPSAKSKYVVGFFACSVAITGASTGTQKSANNLGPGIGNAANSSIVDIAGETTVQLTANNGSTGNWGAIAFSIDFIMAATADHQASMDIIQSSLTGSPNTSSVSAQDLQDAVLGQASNIVSHSAGLSDVKLAASNVGLVSAAINFGQYPNGALPSMFIVMDDHAGTVSGGIQILDGKAQMVTAGTGAYDVENTILYNLQDTKTDFQMVSAVFTNNENTGISTQLITRWNGLELSDPGLIATVLNLNPSSTTEYDAHINNLLGGSGNTIWAGTLPIVPGALYSLLSGCLVLGQTQITYFQVLINLVPQPIGVSGANYVIDTSGLNQYGPTLRKTGFYTKYIKQSTGIIEASYPISYWAMQDQVFPIDVTSNIKCISTQLDTILGDGKDYISEDILEIGAGYSLEIPATSSLEIKAKQGSRNKTAFVVDAEATTSTTYVDLTNTNDQVTALVGPDGEAQVILSVKDVTNTTDGTNLHVSFEMSGANVRTAQDDIIIGTANRNDNGSVTVFLQNLNPGWTTFKMKYRVNAGSFTIGNRSISALV